MIHSQYLIHGSPLYFNNLRNMGSLASLSFICLFIKSLNSLYHLAHCPSMFLSNTKELLLQRQPFENEIILLFLYIKLWRAIQGPPLSIHSRGNWPLNAFSRSDEGLYYSPRNINRLQDQVNMLSEHSCSKGYTKSGKSTSIRERQAEGEGVGQEV